MKLISPRKHPRETCHRQGRSTPFPSCAFVASHWNVNIALKTGSNTTTPGAGAYELSAEHRTMMAGTRALCLFMHIVGAALVLQVCYPAIQQITACTFALKKGAAHYGSHVNTTRLERSPMAPAKRIWLLIASMACGSVIALFRVAIAANDPFTLERCLQLMIWIVTLVHNLTLVTESAWPSRYSIGLRGCLCYGVVAMLMMVESYTRQGPEETTELPLFLERASQSVAGLSILTSLTFPRRSRVFRGGKAVDGEGSSSVLGLFSFQWASSLVAIAHSRRRITLDDLPELDDRMRARALQQDFIEAASRPASNPIGGQSLYKTLFYLYRKPLLNQIVLSLPLCVLAFTPHMALWMMLQLLERNARSDSDSTLLVRWALVCGLTIGLSAWLENWLLWLAMNKISVPMTQQLTSVLYRKVMSRSQRRGGSPDEQNLTNLVAIDAPRIATVACFFYSNFLQAMKLTVSCTLLAHLLGWKSLLGGFSCLIVISPLHRICMDRYAAAERALTVVRDGKMAALTEALHCIRQVKLAALERRWEVKINQLRDRELQAHRAAFHWYLMSVACHLVGPVFVSAVSIGLYSRIHGTLTPSVAFPALSMLGYVQFILGLIPELVSGIIGAKISLRRMDKYLQTEGLPSTVAPADWIEFQRATISYRCQERTQREGSLRDMTVSFRPKELSLVSGPTGAGKSLLLLAILGECEIQSGMLRRPLPPPHDDIYTGGIHQHWVIDNAMAFVPQVPWNEATTIRENILFGLPYDRERYTSVLYACALTKDLEFLEHGDLTEVGPNGFKLSGGQKARIALARALYSRAGILLLDDIFSAVDVHTAQHLFVHALTGELAEGRTRILVTHHVQLCRDRADYLVYLGNGTVSWAGRPSNSLHPEFPASKSSLVDGPAQKLKLQTIPNATNLIDNITKKEQGNFAKEESPMRGAIQQGLLHRYSQISGGWRSWSVVAGCYIAYNGLLLALYYWVRLWTNSGPSETPDHQRMRYYALGYVGIAVAACLVGSLRSYFVFGASLQAARQLFHQTIHGVLHAQLGWLESVPTGRLLNLFAADFYLVDSRLGFDLIGLWNAGMDCVGVVMGAIVVCPTLTIIAALLICAVIRYTKRYVTTVREIKRLEADARSTVYEQFSFSMQGLSTIHAFGRAESYTNQMHAQIDQQAKCSWHLYLLNRWLTFRINVLGTLFSLLTLLFVVSSRSMTGSFAGFALVFTNHLCHALVTLSRSYATAEMDFSAVERVLEYTDVPTEDSTGANVPPGWPTEGRLSVTHLTVAYSPKLSPVLSEISFDVEPGRRIGIVGRTGAGKSSLALAIFRCLEARQGAIWIDGIDISTIKLHHLRSRLAMIPQNPILFKGTVRSNLDPFSEHSDESLIQTLKRVFWSSPEALDAPVSDGGSNLSCGQRQLLCLGRAVLSRPALLVMDEATSAVDRATDELIQRSIRSEISGRAPTLLVIAHRIHTIADFDRVLVLDEGKVVEFGSPTELMKVEKGYFRRLVDRDTGKEYLYKQMKIGSSSTFN
ncbi:hypothetical protein BBP40_002605 [Aspergillus hancockii]|nr:hypothetical protein BBP40_002605 [Aspergillus hancockii]